MGNVPSNTTEDIKEYVKKHFFYKYFTKILYAIMSRIIIFFFLLMNFPYIYDHGRSYL